MGFNLIQTGSWEMAKSMKYLIYKYKDLSSSPRTHIKKPDVRYAPAILVLRRWGLGESQGSWLARLDFLVCSRK